MELTTMKIAISTDGELVSVHYGKTLEFTIADIRSGKIINTEKLSTQGYTKDETINLLKDKKIRRIICNGIGARATKLFNENEIQVIAGISGEITSILKSIINGTIVANSESTCVPGTGVDFIQDGKKSVIK
jgi:predicted Fe-Mo cluster-binding NifX family protein